MVNTSNQTGDADVTPNDVHQFWFGAVLTEAEALDDTVTRWFSATEDFDRELKTQFSALPERARQSELDHWLTSPRGTLALVLLLDQFPRNLYRGTAQAFAYDEQSRRVSSEALERGIDKVLSPLEATFLYMPFEHAEDLQQQRLSVRLFTELRQRAPENQVAIFDRFSRYANEHLEIIERFARFPHRNEILERESSAEELEYLSSGGTTFSS